MELNLSSKLMENVIEVVQDEFGIDNTEWSNYTTLLIVEDKHTIGKISMPDLFNYYTDFVKVEITGDKLINLIRKKRILTIAMRKKND